MKEEEIWRPVVGYIRYEVSNLSNIRIAATKRLIAAFVVGGYVQAALRMNKVYKHVKVHRMSAIAFIPNPENKPQVNHIDGNKLNNNITNFEWVTSSENHLHAFKTGLRVVAGSFGHHSSVTVLDTKTGVYYGSIIEAAKFNNIKIVTLEAKLSGRIKNKTGLIRT